jgi:glucokinase
MALLIRRGDGLAAAPSEGGHAEYAARNATEDALVGYWRERLGRAEIEALLSGTGLVRIHEFVLSTGQARGEPVSDDERDDPAPHISRLGLEGSDEAARRALELYVEMLGSVAGNLALTALATGGFFVGGGIPPKVLPALRAGPFLEAFLDKGAFRDLLSRVPVRVVLDDRAALLGAGRHAVLAAGQTG